ncbi:MAG: phosphate acetyltransferase [Bacteroidales bacterium]|jgi:phosphate acetyltransferase|nr:phosphate acetyltransferase [Bacteroidales bacterium]
MPFVNTIRTQAKSDVKTIVLPESTEPRTLEAANFVIKEKIANIIFIGNPNAIAQYAKEHNLPYLLEAQVIDPLNHPKQEEYANMIVELRKNKGVDITAARALIKNPLYLAATIIKAGDADGEVAGAENATQNVLRPGFQLIKTQEGVSIVSGVFIMIMQDKTFGDNGVMLFADCAVNPQPTEDELAEIAVRTAKTAKTLLNMEARIAMLSFSTHGSAKHVLTEKVARATEIVRVNHPNIIIDGELQADAAIVPEVCAKKSPDSILKGRANTLIFPSLETGNIAYKLVQRFAHAEAYGPILQGLAKPVNDLSRGCSVEDIINVIAITCIQAQNAEKQ